MLRSHLAAVSVSILALAGSASANTLDGPAVVEAAADASFEYSVVFTAGVDGAYLAFWEADGGANTDFPSIIADAFCLFPLEAGSEIIETFSGSLIDPDQNGSVTVWFVDCSGGNFVLETTILPHEFSDSPANVPTGSQWGVLVMTALLLLVAGHALGSRPRQGIAGNGLTNRRGSP